MYPLRDLPILIVRAWTMVGRRVVLAAKNRIACLSYLESSTLPWQPVGLGHLTCVGSYSDA